MQAVILAAGKGSRLGALTKTTPKTLTPVRGKPILEHTLMALPPGINEVIIVVHHLADRIKDHSGNEMNGIPIRYVLQENLRGTADALWQVKHMLHDRFLVLNGDDMYKKEELMELLLQNVAVGLTEREAPSEKYLAIDLDTRGNVCGFHTCRAGDRICIVNGAYLLDERIFSYAKVKTPNGEYGLPHTILMMAKNIPVKGFMMKYWLPVNNPDDLARAESMHRS